jgi:hypothetical protein
MDIAEPAWRPAVLRNLVNDLKAHHTTAGEAAADAPGLTFLRFENGAAIYAAVSGSYAFSSAIAATAPRG